MRKTLLWVIVILTLILLASCALILGGQEGGPDETTPPTTTLPSQPAIVTGWVEKDGNRYYHDASGKHVTGWQEVDGVLRYFDNTGALYSGWLEEEGKTYHLTEEGTLSPAGWLDIGEERYYLTADGSRHIGWLELDGDRYFFRENGTMGRGRVFVSEIEARYFLENGQEIILANPWNAIPDDYEVELVQYSGKHYVAAECYDALKQMLSDCKAAGYTAIVCSANRTQDYQQGLFDKKVQYYINKGYSPAEAEIEAATVVAYPGTSEHQLGLAVDLVDINYQLLNEAQEKTEAQKWLMENSWRYGFILRYPNEKSDVTGIVYEPWHYRYVGVELATELYETKMCLEEYLEALTRE